MTDEQILRRIKSLREYLLTCVDAKDWHGVMDAAVDIRELEAELKGRKHGRKKLIRES